MTYTYIVRCKDNSLYTGYTTDIKNRVNNHNNGKGDKYTKGRRPVEMVYFETFESKSKKKKKEIAIKKMPRSKKEQLIETMDKDVVKNAMN
mgnify:FL=1